jgi:hypothetical protein
VRYGGRRETIESSFGEIKTIRILLILSLQLGLKVPATSFVTVKVYNVLGVEVVTLVRGYFSLGQYETQLDASSLPSGIYFCQLTAEAFSSTRKMVLLR